VINTRIEVRPATADDLPAVNDIYNQYVVEAHYTFDLEAMAMEARREWFTHYGERGRHRLLVAISDARVIGYACSSQFRTKPAYETSVETSVYLAPDAVGRGAGSRLYEKLFKALEGEDVHRAYAGIALLNPLQLDCTSASVSKGSVISRSRDANSAATGTSPGMRRRLDRNQPRPSKVEGKHARTAY